MNNIPSLVISLVILGLYILLLGGLIKRGLTNKTAEAAGGRSYRREKQPFQYWLTLLIQCTLLLFFLVLTAIRISEFIDAS